MSITEVPHQAQEHVEDSKVRRKWCVENFQNIKVVSPGKQGTRHYEMGKIMHGFIAHLKDSGHYLANNGKCLNVF